MSECTFEGFEQANTTPVPDILFDRLLTELSGAELKVLLYIIRRTKGFKKDTDAISLNQLQHGITTQEGKVLDKGCGIKRRDTICEALTSLETKHCITSQKRKTSSGDNATTVYGIYFKESKEVVTKPDYPSHQTGLPLVTEANHRSPVLALPVVTKPDPQETVIQQTELQDTEEDVNANALTPTPSQENENAYPQDETTSQQKQAGTVDNSQQANKDIPIANTDPHIDALQGVPIE